MVVVEHGTQDCERAEGKRDKSNWCRSCQNLRAEKAERERDEALAAHMTTITRIRNRLGMHTTSAESLAKLDKNNPGRALHSAEHLAAMSFRLVVEHVEREDMGHMRDERT